MIRVGKFEFQLVDDGILSISCVVPNAHLTLEDAEFANGALMELAAGIRRPVLFDVRNVVKADWQNQSYVRDQLEKIALAGAIVTNSTVETVLATLFLKIWVPTFPTRTFSSRASAIEWLKSYLAKN